MRIGTGWLMTQSTDPELRRRRTDTTGPADLFSLTLVANVKSCRGYVSSLSGHHPMFAVCGRQ